MWSRLPLMVYCTCIAAGQRLSLKSTGRLAQITLKSYPHLRTQNCFAVVDRTA